MQGSGDGSSGWVLACHMVTWIKFQSPGQPGPCLALTVVLIGSASADGTSVSIHLSAFQINKLMIK